MEFLAALIGTVIGALVVFLSELWRQVLNGKAAARLIYVESHQNALMCDWAANREFYRPLSDHMWQAHSVQITPLLTNEASQLVSVAYLGTPAAQLKIDSLAKRETDATDAANELQTHSISFQQAAHWMYAVENKSRSRLLLEILTGRPRLPSANEIERGIEAIEP